DRLKQQLAAGPNRLVGIGQPLGGAVLDGALAFGSELIVHREHAAHANEGGGLHLLAILLIAVAAMPVGVVALVQLLRRLPASLLQVHRLAALVDNLVLPVMGVVDRHVPVHAEAVAAGVARE